MVSSDHRDKDIILVPENSLEDKFPEGLRVLAIDDDNTCLVIVEKLLLRCRYEVTTCREVSEALELLRDNKMNFDIVITDVCMPDMDGFRLMEIIGLEMDIPVIMMSVHDDKTMVMKGIEHGACDYLVKPIRLEEIKNIWQHVIRKNKLSMTNLNTSKLELNQIRKSKKKRNNHSVKTECEDGYDSDEECSSKKKPRAKWSEELHKRFVAAYDKLGPDKAVPSKILEHMNVPELTREKVASHLQKYRIGLNKSRNHQGSNNFSSSGVNKHLTDLEEQGRDRINYFGGFRDNNYPSTGMSQFSHHLSPTPSSISLYHPHGNIPQQYPQLHEGLDQNFQRISVPGIGDVHSNPPKMRNFNQQSYDNCLRIQPFTPRPRMWNEYLESPPSNVLAYDTHNIPNSSGSLLFDCVPNAHPFDISSNFVGSQIQILSNAGSNTLSGGAQDDSVVTAAQNTVPEGEHVMENFDALLSSCGDYDLTAVLNQMR